MPCMLKGVRAEFLDSFIWKKSKDTDQNFCETKWALTVERIEIEHITSKEKEKDRGVVKVGTSADGMS